MESKFGEIKTRAKLYPSQAREIVEKGTVGILFSQCDISDKTLNILKEGNITVYAGISNEKVIEVIEGIKNKGGK